MTKINRHDLVVDDPPVICPYCGNDITKQPACAHLSVVYFEADYCEENKEGKLTGQSLEHWLRRASERDPESIL